MARKVEIILIDDIDGTNAESTVEFSFNGVDYEIDLNAKNLERLESALDEFIGKARKVQGHRTKKAAAGARVPAAEVRRWAAETGVEVSPRGRIPKHVMDAYLAAH